MLLAKYFFAGSVVTISAGTIDICSVCTTLWASCFHSSPGGLPVCRSPCASTANHSRKHSKVPEQRATHSYGTEAKGSTPVKSERLVSTSQVEQCGALVAHLPSSSIYPIVLDGPAVHERLRFLCPSCAGSRWHVSVVR